MRLINQTGGERNYHIFYELMGACAADDNMRQSLGLTTPDCFNYTSNEEGLVLRSDNVDDLNQFKSLARAMAILGFADKERSRIYSILAGILHIGNLVIICYLLFV